MVTSKDQTTTSSDSDDILDAVLAVLGMLFKGLFRLLWWAILFPMLSVPVAAAVLAWTLVGWQLGAIVVVASVVLLTVWAVFAWNSFRRAVPLRMWKRWRRWSVYRRDWADTCALHGLTAMLNGSPLVPVLKRARIGETADVLTVALLPGQTVADWTGQADALAHAFRAMSVSARSSERGWVTVTVHHRDALAASIPLNVSGAADGLAIGRVEDGTPWTVPVLGKHILVAGATGAGKGSVVWSILAGLAPELRRGEAQAWVIDPKGGMEFGRGIPMFARFSYDTGEQTLQLLRDAATLLAERANRLRGQARLHEPTVDEPLIVLIVDELASLTAYVADRKIKAEIEQLLALILSQGRAVGVSVIACVQDPSKDVLAVRQLFPTRIGLRLTEATQVAMVLGQGARERGALCDLIPDAAPGVGYVAEDGSTDLHRVRAFNVTDADIDSLGAAFPTTDEHE